jgi:hypothetical protein
VALFTITVQLHEPNDYRPHYCLEVFRKIRRGTVNRQAHLGFDVPLSDDDGNFMCEVVTDEVARALREIVGLHGKLEF